MTNDACVPAAVPASAAWTPGDALATERIEPSHLLLERATDGAPVLFFDSGETSGTRGVRHALRLNGDDSKAPARTDQSLIGAGFDALGRPVALGYAYLGAGRHEVELSVGANGAWSPVWTERPDAFTAAMVSASGASPVTVAVPLAEAAGVRVVQVSDGRVEDVGEVQKLTGPGGVGELALARAPANGLLLAWTEPVSGLVAVRRFVDGAWHDVGGPIQLAGPGELQLRPAIVALGGERILLAVGVHSGSSWRLSTTLWDGARWMALPPIAESTTGAMFGPARLTLDAAGDALAIWNDPATTGDALSAIHVSAFTGCGWKQLDTGAGPVASPFLTQPLAVGVDGAVAAVGLQPVAEETYALRTWQLELSR